MTLRNLFIENSVKHVSKNSKTRSENSPMDANSKSASFLNEQNKNLSQNNKTFNKI